MRPNIRGRSPLSTNRTLGAAAAAAGLLTLVSALPLAAQEPRDGHAWEETWSLDISRGASAPLVWADSMIVVASLDRNLHLVALEPAPRVVWRENFKGGFEAPPVVTDRRIYLAETARGRRLVALDRLSRTVAWHADVGDMASPPLVAGDRIYVASSIGEVRALDPAGTQLWLTELATRVVSPPVLLDETLVVAASDGTLHALDPVSGRLLSSVDAEAGPIWSPPVLRDGSTGTALYATLDGQLVEVDADLTVLQRRSFPSRFYAAPRAAGDRLFLVGHEGTLWAYDWSTAEIVWRREIPGAVRLTPALGPGTVVVGDLGGTLYVLDRTTGELLWHAGLDDAITSEPLTRGDDLYVITESGTLYAFRPTGSAAPSR